MLPALAEVDGPRYGELRADAVAMCRVCYGDREASMALIPPESVRRRLALKVLSRLDGAN